MAARPGSAGSLVTKPNARKVCVRVNLQPAQAGTKERRPRLRTASIGRAREGTRRQKATLRSDRELKPPRHLLLDWLDGARHRLLSERAEVLALASHRFDLLPDEVGLERDEIGQRLHREHGL